MVLRLLVDLVRRTRWFIAAAEIQLFMFSKAIFGFWPSTDPLACVMAGAALLTLVAGPIHQSREIYQLPISRRTLWLARWWMSTAGAVLAAALPALIARWSELSVFPTLDQLLVITVCAFLYCGCAMTLVATRWGRLGDQPANRRAMQVWFVTLALPLGAPFFLARYLPHSVGAIDIQSAIVMLAMAAVAARGYVHQPALEARPSLRAPRRAPERAAATPTRPADRLTGPTVALWHVSRAYLIAYAAVIGAGIAWWWVSSFYWTAPPLADVLRKVDMLPFASRTAQVTEAITVGELLFIAAMIDVLRGTNLRPLRTLPLSATQLGCIPVVMGLVSASMLWLVFFALHLMVLRTAPVSVRPDLFAAFAALAALAQTIRLMLSGNPVVTSMAGLAPLCILWLLLGDYDTFRPDIVQPAMLFGGLATLAASFVLMRHAVTHSSRIYRPQPMRVRFGG